MTMKIVRKLESPGRFETARQILARKTDYIHPMYEEEWLEYLREYNSSHGTSIMDTSFCIMDADGTPVSCLTIAREEIAREAGGKGLIRQAYGSWPVEILEDSDKIGRASLSLVDEEIRQIARQGNSSMYIRSANLKGSSGQVYAHLISSSQSRTSLSTHGIVDLRLDEAETRRNLRKSYKSLVNKAGRIFDIGIYTGTKVNNIEVGELIDLHRREAGRMTRSIRSWELQLKACYNNKGFIITCRKNRELVSFAIFAANSRVSYYAVAASKRELFELPLGHGVLWNGIEFSKRIGCKYLDLGSTWEDGGSADSKERSIAMFKDGFCTWPTVVLDSEVELV